MKAFIDTGGFVGSYYAVDPYHQEAVFIWERFLKERWRLYTTNYVVAETLTLLRMRSNHSQAVKFGEGLFASKVVQIIRVAPDHDAAAWEIFKKYSDQDFSFVDCSSFAVMWDLGIFTAFAFDHHFSAMGFERLPA